MIVFVQCVIIGLGGLFYDGSPDFQDDSAWTFVDSHHGHSGQHRAAADRAWSVAPILWTAPDCHTERVPIDDEPVTGDDIRQVYIEWENDASYPGDKPEFEDYLADWFNGR